MKGYKRKFLWSWSSVSLCGCVLFKADVCMARGPDFPQTCKSCKMRICLISTNAFLTFIAILYVSDAYRNKMELLILIKN